MFQKLRCQVIPKSVYSLTKSRQKETDTHRKRGRERENPNKIKFKPAIRKAGPTAHRKFTALQLKADSICVQEELMPHISSVSGRGKSTPAGSSREPKIRSTAFFLSEHKKELEENTEYLPVTHLHHSCSKSTGKANRNVSASGRTKGVVL